MIVPRDPRLQYSQLAVIAANMDAGREPMAGARQVGPDRYILEDCHVVGRVPSSTKG
jgi:hypothetical protein